MASWVESASASFECRHSSDCTEDAARVLGALERMRERLERVYPRTVSDMTIVLHDSPGSLGLSNPLMPVAWAISAPSARRYVTGWVGRRELHVLSPEALRARASGVPGSYEMLARAPDSLYARRVILECNHDVRHSRVPARGLIELQWAWLLEGASRWFAGETRHSRAAIGRRMREGGRPRFPPTIRDAPLLGSTVIDLLVQREGELAAAQLSARLHPQGSRAALTKAFGSRALAHVESDWRAHLAKLASAG